MPTLFASSAITRSELVDIPFGSIRRVTARVALIAAVSLLADTALAQQVWVASGNAVVALDQSSHLPTATIPLPAAPTRIVASPDGRRVYVSHAATGLLSVIDTAASAVIATPAIGPSPSALAVSPDGATLYVSTAGSTNGVVQVVKTATLATVAHIDTPSAAGGDLAITADGSRIYYASGVVSVIDTATRRVVDTFGSSAFQVEVSPDGSHAFVSSSPSVFGGVFQIFDLGAGNTVIYTLDATPIPSR
jgi:YVTN family beta-propeller protein